MPNPDRYERCVRCGTMRMTHPIPECSGFVRADGGTALTEFLLARIAEDEAAAKGAEQGRWKLWGMTVMADPKATGNVDDCITVADARTPSWCDRVPRTWNAAHIARHDPARVLAECELKRQIVELFPHAADGDGWNNAGEEVLLRLAAVYADHPDYQEEWKP